MDRDKGNYSAKSQWPLGSVVCSFYPWRFTPPLGEYSKFGVLDVYPEIISLCSDNAGENTSHKLTKFLDDHHIKHQLMTPYEHEQMGKVERANRTI